MRSMTVIPAALAIGLLAVSPRADACGGFFCNAANPVPILQAGERVLFAKSGGRTVMHVEVAYAGLPTSFGWLLPLSGLPLGADGQPLPLDQALQLSHASVFEKLQATTAPSFSVQNTFADGGCFGFPGGVQDSSVSAYDVSEPGFEPPPVAVLQEAAVGPYAAQIIQATDADALFAWLNTNGYIQDENARPHLAHYVGQKYVFLGLRLQNGKGTGDLRPVALTLPEEAPCVPLRLTSIAATPDMPILVFVLGEGRAVPKNNFAATVNPKALSWPGASNYLSVISDAVDAVSGHAFVTEYSGPASEFAQVFASPAVASATELKDAKTMAEVLSAYSALGLPTDATYQAIVRSLVKPPEGLMGYPYGNCYYDSSFGRGGFGADAYAGSLCGPNEEHATTDAEFYNYLDWWVTSGGVVLDDVAGALRDRLIDEVVEPLTAVQGLFDGATTLTRFLTILDPDQMDRDPIFAFNPALPDVPRAHVVNTTVHDPDCSGGWIEAAYPDGTVHIFECDGFCGSLATLPPVPGAPALLVAEVIDESGDPKPVSPSEYATVDGYLALATGGTPTLPDGVVVTPPAEPPPVTGNDAGHTVTTDVGGVSDAGSTTDVGPSAASSDSGGCSSGAAPHGSWAPWLLLLGLIALLRRERAR